MVVPAPIIARAPPPLITPPKVLLLPAMIASESVPSPLVTLPVPVRPCRVWLVDPRLRVPLPTTATDELFVRALATPSASVPLLTVVVPE